MCYVFHNDLEPESRDLESRSTKEWLRNTEIHGTK